MAHVGIADLPVRKERTEVADHKLNVIFGSREPISLQEE